MGSRSSRSPASGARWWLALTACAAVFAAGLLEQLVHDRPAYAEHFAPGWLPRVAAALAAAGLIVRSENRARGPRLGETLIWSGLLLMLWTAGGLVIDLLRVAGRLTPGFMPPEVDWPGLATRALSLTAVVVLARLALAGAPDPASDHEAGPSGTARWYGYAALALALPYPVLKTWWALGGTVGLESPGAAGLAGSLTLWLPAVPWLLAAALSLLLALTPPRLPRRLLLAAGWSATAVVAPIGTAACWSLVSGLIAGGADFGEMSGWVFALFYGSWLLWAIAVGAATRSYQVRSAGAVTRAAGTSVDRPSAAAS